MPGLGPLPIVNPFHPIREWELWVIWRRANEPICVCGDYRDQHEGGLGRCRLCRPYVPWENCRAFRFWKTGS